MSPARGVRLDRDCGQRGAVFFASSGPTHRVRRIESGASSSDLHHAGPVTPGGSNHVPLSGADLIELSNFTGRGWGFTGQGLSVARAPCARSFSSGHLVLASRPSEEMVRPLWAPGPSPMECHAGVWPLWAPGGALGRKSDGNRDFPGGGCPLPHRFTEVRGQVGFLGQDRPTILAFSPQS